MFITLSKILDFFFLLKCNHTFSDNGIKRTSVVKSHTNRAKYDIIINIFEIH